MLSLEIILEKKPLKISHNSVSLEEIRYILAYRNSWNLDGRVGRWTLDTGLWTLDSELWTLDTVADCCRTKSEPIFIVKNRITLQAPILDCSEAAVHSHPFAKIPPGNTGGRVTD